MKGKIPEGKVPWELIADRLGGALPPEVVLGPGQGEDAALVRIGGEVWAVASDPISFTAADAGRLAVVVNANDVAVRGADPRFFLAVVLLAPGEATSERAEGILTEIRTACDRLGVALVGGHTEVTPGLPHSIVVGTMLGPVRDRPLTTGGLRPGDRIGMTKWAGLEGTSILLAELGDRLRTAHGAGAFRAAEEILAGDWLSVVPEASIAAGVGAVSALHDVTEGGVGEALFELSRASGLELEVGADQIPVRPETRVVCDDLGMDPLGLIGSGALLVGCAEAGRGELEERLRERGIPFTWIGRALTAGESPAVTVPRFRRDEILKAWLLAGVRAVVFDLDGTLVEADYDWPAIRRDLEITGASIIDQLHRLPEPERTEKWASLIETERQASRGARLREGARELLAGLRERRIPVALVTNNTDENTRQLMARFGLEFEVVLTRDSGLWKPSGAPIQEAVRQLGVEPGECLAVGDSLLDVRSAREAGCGWVCAVYGGAERYRDQADLSFADLPRLRRYLELVL